jgi:hypothetical protein
MGPEFVNAYIENLTKEMGELLKLKILLQTQLDLQQKITAELQQRLIELEKANEKLSKKTKKDDSTF